VNKKLLVKHQSESGTTGTTKEVHAETIEQALKDLAKQVKKGEVQTPLTLEFEGPGGLQFNVTVTSADDVHEISTMGFMF
jgi:hypothetical protein